LSWGRSESQASINDLKRRVDETQEAWVSLFEDAKRKAVEKGEVVLSSVRRRRRNSSEIGGLQRPFRGIESDQHSMDEQRMLMYVAFLTTLRVR
jgi:hypothetical protein